MILAQGWPSEDAGISFGMRQIVRRGLSLIVALYGPGERFRKDSE